MHYSITIMFIFAISLSVVTDKAISGEHVFSDALSSYTSSEKKAFFKKYLNASGESCDSVSTIFHKGIDSKRGYDYWSIQYTKNKAYQVQVKNDSNLTTNIVDCVAAAAVGADCWEPL